VQSWAKDALKSHRVGILAHALCHHLQREADLITVKQSNSSALGLGQFLSDAGPAWSQPLCQVLRKLGIEPVKR
jgi:hypothetical protein